MDSDLSNSAKQTGILCGSINVQATDALAAAVQTAAEGMAGIDTDRRPRLVVQIDVIGQPEPFAAVAESIFIDLRLQGGQLANIENLIGSSFRAAARPYRRPHGIERQRFIFLYAYGGRGNAAVVFQLERNLTAGRLAPAEECAVLVLEAQLRIGLNGEASVGIAFDPLLLRYSRSFAAVGVIDKGDHALHAGFKAAVPARDMHGVIGRLLFVDPLQCTGNIFAGSIQHIHQLNIADFIGLFPIDFGYCDTLRLVGVSDTSTVLDVDTGFPGNISIVAVDHRAAADVVGLPRCAGHRAEVVAVGDSGSSHTSNGYASFSPCWAGDFAKVGRIENRCSGGNTCHSGVGTFAFHGLQFNIAFVPALSNRLRLICNTSSMATSRFVCTADFACVAAVFDFTILAAADDTSRVTALVSGHTRPVDAHFDRAAGKICHDTGGMTNAVATSTISFHAAIHGQVLHRTGNIAEETHIALAYGIQCQRDRVAFTVKGPRKCRRGIAIGIADGYPLIAGNIDVISQIDGLATEIHRIDQCAIRPLCRAVHQRGKAEQLRRGFKCIL